MCPNEGCQDILKWDNKFNIRCSACQYKNRQYRWTGAGKKLKWRWHRCLAEDCKAMYVFNRGKRLSRSAALCRMRRGFAQTRKNVRTKVIDSLSVRNPEKIARPSVQL